MEYLNTFFESSTIHGVSYLASTRKLHRLFWIFVVFAGFSGAGYLIQQSFQVWQDNPITTTIETRPISEVTFPLITVCPPKGTHTNFNYDLEQTKDVKIRFDKDILYDSFLKHFRELDYRKYVNKWMTGFKLENRHKHWYTGAR